MPATDSHDAAAGDMPQPSQHDIDQIISLYEGGELAQMEHASRTLADSYPASAVAWRVLATALQLQGKDAVPAWQKTVELAPDDAEAHFSLGNAHIDVGQLALATNSLMRTLELAPGSAEALSRLGDVLQAQGHAANAAECYRGALAINPALASALVGRADVLQSQQQYQAAEAGYRQALALMPDNADLHRKLADVQVALNRPEQAMQGYAKALQADPDNAMAHGGLGNVLFRLDRNAQAAASYRAATVLPGTIAAHYHGLGRSLHALNETAEAEAAYRQAIALDPGVAAPMLHYADLLRETRRKEPAIAIYRAALLLEPRNIDALNNLGMALQEDGQLEQALSSFQQVLALAPDNPVSHSNIAAVLNAMGQQNAALESCRRAVKAGPKLASAHVNLGTCLMEMGRLNEAIQSFETVVGLDPHNRRAHVNISAALTRLGRTEEAIAHARRALKINPDWDELHSNLLFYLTHSQDMDADTLFAEHLRYARHFEAPLHDTWPQHDNQRDPDRRLRIGFVSADLYNHAVAHFITPVLEYLAVSPQFEIVIYANSYHDDVISRHLHGLASLWRQVEKLTHAELAQLITRDSIDILVDLSGHTGFNRLPALAHKPAPLQVTWIGYPGTTGLQAMDYYLTDRFFSPPGVVDKQFTEKMVRLPACATFRPAANAPAVGDLPVLKNGHITFGSFNRINKLTPAVIARWSALLRALPDSTILFAAIPNQQASDRLRSSFEREGIAPERLSFHAPLPAQEYLALHNQVDICLDTSPYNGGTTTLHALWMGVPTLTITGSTLPSRAGATILQHVDLADCIAQDDEDFINKGKALAGNLAYLAQLRATLRERLHRSAVCTPALVAAGFGRAMRMMWQRWCAGEAPMAFDVDAPQGDQAADDARGTA